MTKQFIQSNQASIGRIDPIWLEAGYQSATEQSVIQLHLDVFPAWNQSTFFTDRDDLSFNVMEDEFFPMGDNSPASADARWNKWTIDMGKNTFNRKLFIGEALMIYWPHPHGEGASDCSATETPLHMPKGAQMARKWQVWRPFALRR